MARAVDDDLVILDVTSGRYFSLNPVGAFVWSLLESPTTRAAIVDAVVTSYEVDRHEAQADVDELLAHLANVGLLNE